MLLYAENLLWLLEQRLVQNLETEFIQVGSFEKDFYTFKI